MFEKLNIRQNFLIIQKKILYFFSLVAFDHGKYHEW